MLRLELLRLLRKWLGAEVLVAVSSGRGGKDSMRRLDYGIAFWGRGAFQKLCFVYWNYYIWILMWDIVYLVIVSALCINWLTRMTMDVGLAELLCGLWNVMFEVDSLNIWNEFNPLRIGLNWVNYVDDVKDRILLKFSLGCFNCSGFDKWFIVEPIL